MEMLLFTNIIHPVVSLSDKPNFSDQGTTEFYNWLGNKDSYLTCTANGNPVPGFKWYKGETEINPGFEYHQVEKSVVDAENPHRATSKLLVSIVSVRNFT